MEAVKDLDLKRFMGDWHVIANIPTFVEKNTRNNLESYKLGEDGNVEITFSLTTAKNERKTYRAKGFVLDQKQPSRWKVQYYSYTVIGLPSRKYAWIMAREPNMDPELYQDILARLSDIGYNVEDIQKVPFTP
jgi:apolipoprotein D and lipocalin family protein